MATPASKQPDTDDLALWPPGADPEVFFGNLAALAERSPELAERLCWPVDGSHVRAEADAVLYRVHAADFPLAIPAAEAERRVAVAIATASAPSAATATASSIAPAVGTPVATASATPSATSIAPSLATGIAPVIATGSSEPHVLVFGVGLGELVEQALARGLRTTAWDRDPWLLRLWLGRSDHRRELASGALCIALGTDLLAIDRSRVLLVAHPLLEQVYARERTFFERGALHAIAPPFARARGACGDLELPDRDHPQRRALLCAGGLCVDSLGRELEARGFGVWTCDAERLSREELEHTARVLKPELVASINYREGLADFAHAIGAKLLVWEIDPATSPIRSSEASGGAEHARIFSYRRESVRVFRAAGFRRAEYLPLAADASLRRPLELTAEERAHYCASVSFVGSSMAVNAEDSLEHFLASFARWRRSSEDRRRGRAIVEEIAAIQRADFVHFAARELLEERAPGFVRWCAASGEHCDPVVLLGEIYASEKRLAWLANLGVRLAARPDVPFARGSDASDPACNGTNLRLSPGVTTTAEGAWIRGGADVSSRDRQLHVWGDSGWERIAQRGVRYRGPASHVRDVTRIYCASAINLDIGRLYQTDIATLRTFDVLACGGFALVEHNDALAELFDVGRDLETYRDFPELWEKVRHYLEHPDEARAIAERGHAAVLARHTFAQRVDHMLRSLERDEAVAAAR